MAMLSGVRVVELTTMITGPLAGMLLADLGASVIKIENREGGDLFRSFRGGRYSGHFISYNRNKRSLTLDLRTPQGKEICLSLLRQADVLIDNFRHGVLDRLGLSDAVLREANPRLIHASITGFGASGPYRDRPSYDAVAQALSGVLSQFIDPESPEVAGPTLSDNISGFYAAYGILGAGGAGYSGDRQTNKDQRRNDPLHRRASHTIFFVFSSAARAASKPSSARISSVCSPSVGGGAIGPGRSPSIRSGGNAPETSPSVGCATR